MKPALWHWEYHPTTNQPIALIGPDGSDVLLITGDAQGHVYAEMPAGKAEFIRDALNAYIALPALLEAAKAALELTRLRSENPAGFRAPLSILRREWRDLAEAIAAAEGKQI